MRKNITREYLQHNREGIFDLIQFLTDVVRFADRNPDAPNADFYKDYLKLAQSTWYRLF